MQAQSRYEQRIKTMIGQMTLEEKVGQMMHTAPAIDRLGIPQYNWWNECLHGVGRAGAATVFPQAIGMAASWNAPLLFRTATAISDEARAKHHEFVRLGHRDIYQGLTFWTPNINIFRDPRWGRGQETYGEDPYLTSRLAVNFIKGLQGDDPNYLKLVATAKHFAVHSGPEAIRHSFDANISRKDLYETYLPHFEATVKEAHVESIMCAYNRLYGKACCGSDQLLIQILRDDWGFKGYVVSDCWAVADFYEPNRHGVSADKAEASALAVLSGTDVECGESYTGLVEAVKRGSIAESAIDASLYRIMEARFRLGMFDDPAQVKWAQIPYSVVNSQPHRDLALQMARESMVLLKNEGNVLPLSKGTRSVAVIGPNANDVQVMLGNYHGTPLHMTTPLEGIRQKLGKDATVYYAPGSRVAGKYPLLAPIPSTQLYPTNRDADVYGLSAEYYAKGNWEGEVAAKQVDPHLQFTWKDKTPVSGRQGDAFSVRWSGYLMPRKSGTHVLALRAHNIGKLYLNDSLLFSFRNPHEPSLRTVEVNLEAGRFYSIRVELDNFGADPQCHLMWEEPTTPEELRAEAIERAKNAEVVVFFMGLTPFLEGEEMDTKYQIEGFNKGDRTEIGMPATQVELMQAIKKQFPNKKYVMVLMSGSAVSTEWANEQIPGILAAWYPGEAGGQAIADVLFGDYNPAGRLPLTFYRSVSDLPAFESYDMKGRTYRYFTGKPLYPFGHGLSYTQFTYSGLKISKKGADAIVTVTVKNTGSRAGDEVAQLYVTDQAASVAVPVRSLQGFQRVNLQPGESKVLTFTLTPKQLAIVNESGERILEPGAFTITVGGKQPGFSGLADAATTQTVSASYQVGGKAVKLPD